MLLWFAIQWRTYILDTFGPNFRIHPEEQSEPLTASFYQGFHSGPD